MAKKMKAAVVHKFGQPLVIDELAVPEPKEGQALVKIEASGVCHTDLHAADGDWPVKPTPPFVPGHEGAGVVAALGPGAKHLKERDRVGIAWLHSACGHLRVLSIWMGNSVSPTTELRVFREWQLRRICRCRRRLSRTHSR